MPRSRVLMIPILVIASVCAGFWLWMNPGWSGKPLDQHIVTDGIELTVAEFRHRDAENVMVYAARIDPEKVFVLIALTSLIEDEPERDFIATADRHQAAAMVNGGYFDADNKPVGLVVKDGESIQPLSEQAALSGVLAVLEDGTIQLVPRDGFTQTDQIQTAIQAGPFLIDPGGLPGIRSDDLKEAPRTAIGLTTEGEVVLLSTSPCTLFQLSEILTQRPEKLRVAGFDRVLNLDGGPSAGLYLEGLEDYRVLPDTTVPSKIIAKPRPPSN